MFAIAIRSWMPGASRRSLHTCTDGSRTSILEHAIDGKLLLSCWLGTCRLKRLPKKRWELYGLSRTVYDDAGKVADHTDYYDSSPILEYFPVLGRSVALIRKLYMR